MEGQPRKIEAALESAAMAAAEEIDLMGSEGFRVTRRRSQQG